MANQKPINKGKILGIIITVVAVLMIAMAGALWEDADKSKNYVCQMPVTGNYVVWTDGGLQWQGLGTVRSYSKTSQIEFTGLEKNKDGYVAAGSNPAAALTFNDKGRGFIVGSFRVVMPNDAKKAKQVALKVQAEGEAKAAANRALVAAGLTPAEKAEWDYKTAVGVAEALANSKVQWVPSVMFGGNGSGNNAMDAVGLKMLMDITKSFDKK
jgi:hypothetical protein